jgi:hypothetical protein
MTYFLLPQHLQHHSRDPYIVGSLQHRRWLPTGAIGSYRKKSVYREKKSDWLQVSPAG